MPPIDWALAAPGAVLLVVGLVSLRWGRMHGHDPDRVARSSLFSPSIPTRYVIGLAALFAGYHLAAWGLPPAWLPLRVPIDRAWIVALVAGGTVACSIAIDLVEGRRAG